MEDERNSPPDNFPKKRSLSGAGALTLSLAFQSSAFSKAFRGVGSSLRDYWDVYGRLEAVVTSPFLLASAVFTVICAPLWNLKDGWTEAAITILPCLLGFSVSAMAIVLAFATSPIFRDMSEDGHPKSYYMGVAARLAHFIYAQVLALLFVFVVKSYNHLPLRFIGFLLLVYAIFAAAAVGMSFFGAAKIYNASQTPKAPPTKRFAERLAERRPRQ